jgi:hypothetical protein
MTDEYEAFERKCKTIREANMQLLAGFEAWLTGKGLGANTIKKHASNVDFYVNEFLTYDDPPRSAAEGVGRLDYFLGYWFVRKAMWSSPAAIRENAAALKKFYTYLAEIGQVSPGDLAQLRDDIKTGMPEWITTIQRYGDPDVDSEDVWQW